MAVEVTVGIVDDDAIRTTSDRWSWCMGLL